MTTILEIKDRAAVPEPDFFTARELSVYLNVSEKFVRKHTDAGRLPLVRMGRCIRFPRREIDRRLLSGNLFPNS
jgi:excisionase family DNA binding protein